MTGTFRRLRNSDPVTRPIIRLASLCVVLLVAVGALAFSLVATSQADRIAVAQQGSCQFWHDLTVLPTTAKSTKALLLIIADSRVAYITQGCSEKFGQLPSPDPRAVPYIPKGFR